MRRIGVLAVALCLLSLPVGADAYDRLVNPFHTCSLNGPPQYDTLQDAVNAATPGDQIGVCPGTYDQTVVVGTSVTLTAIGSVVIGAPALSSSICFDIAAPGVTMRYFVIRNCGVRVAVEAAGALIQNNQFQSNDTGVAITAPDAIVQNNLLAASPDAPR